MGSSHQAALRAANMVGGSSVGPGARLSTFMARPHSAAPPSLQSLESAQSCSSLTLTRYNPHPLSPTTKALIFEGSKKVPLNHPYSASVSASAKWAHVRTAS